VGISRKWGDGSQGMRMRRKRERSKGAAITKKRWLGKKGTWEGIRPTGVRHGNQKELVGGAWRLIAGRATETPYFGGGKP